MYVLENAMFWHFFPVDAEPGFSAEDLEWSELLVPGLGRLILWKNKASWNLVLVEGIKSFNWKIFNVPHPHLPSAYQFGGVVLG